MREHPAHETENKTTNHTENKITNHTHSLSTFS